MITDLADAIEIHITTHLKDKYQYWNAIPQNKKLKSLQTIQVSSEASDLLCGTYFSIKFSHKSSTKTCYLYTLFQFYLIDNCLLYINFTPLPIKEAITININEPDSLKTIIKTIDDVISRKYPPQTINEPHF